MFKFLLCVFIAVAAVAAYDFSDSDFNEFLFEELKADLADALEPLARTRRDAEVAADKKKECGRRDYKKDFMCCARPNTPDQESIESSFKEFKDAHKQCQIEIRGANADDSFDPFDCQKMQQVKEQMVCVSECISKKMNLIDEKTGELKRDDLVKELLKKSENLKLGWSKEKVGPMVDACLAEIKAKKAVAAEETKGCNNAPLDFHRCVWRFEYQEGCPVEQRIDSPKCNKIRERVSKGDTSFLNKHFVHHFHKTHHEE